MKLRSELVSRSVHARLQVSVCSGYDLCHPGKHPDTQTDTQTTFWPPDMNSSASWTKKCEFRGLGPLPTSMSYGAANATLHIALWCHFSARKKVGPKWSHSIDVLCGVKGQLKVVSTIVTRQLVKVERVWIETVNQRTERKSVTPTTRQVRHVYALHNQSINQSVSQLINQLINQ